MALNPIRKQLRNISNGVAKVQINVAAGDEIEVSEDVAAQLAHQGAPFRDTSSPAATPEPAEVADPAPSKKVPAKKTAAKKRA